MVNLPAIPKGLPENTRYNNAGEIWDPDSGTVFEPNGSVKRKGSSEPKMKKGP